MLGVLGPGDGIHIIAASTDTRLILLAAKPLNEPVAWAGPFVMNTREEIMQAFRDFSF